MQLPRELEDAIVAAPDDRAVYSVAGDWLQQQGSPQGELVALSIAYAAGNSAGETDRVRALQHELLPPAFRTQGIEWRWGFVRGVAISTLGDPEEARALRELLASPIGRFVQKLVIVAQANRSLAEVVYEPQLRCLRTLLLFVEEQRVDLARLSAAVPALRRLIVRGWTYLVLDLPHLEELVLSRSKQVSSLIPHSRLPRLETLQIDNAALDPRPDQWLRTVDLPCLRWVGIAGKFEERCWLESFIGRQLEQLDHYTIERGVATERRIIIDRRPRGGPAALVTMVGKTLGEVIPIDQWPLTIGRAADARVRLTGDVAPRHAELWPFDGGWGIRGVDRDVYVNGHAMPAAPLRTSDELAVGDHVFRFIEGDVDGHLVRLRARYGF